MFNSILKDKFFYPLTFVNMAFAISLGAIGAHALKKSLAPTKLETFLTGNRYHFYITFSLILFLLIEKEFPNLRLTVSKLLSLIALILFTFGCYAYALTGIKPFVHIVPIGGVSFIFAWLFAVRSYLKAT